MGHIGAGHRVLHWGCIGAHTTVLCSVPGILKAAHTKDLEFWLQGLSEGITDRDHGWWQDASAYVILFWPLLGSLLSCSPLPSVGDLKYGLLSCMWFIVVL